MNNVQATLQFENSDLKNVVSQDNELKNFLVSYVGKKLKNKEVTIEMIVEVMSKDFPEFLLVLAEENFIRGYEQALVDVESHEANFKKKKRK